MKQKFIDEYFQIVLPKFLGNDSFIKKIKSSDDLAFAFRHKDQICNSLKKQKPHDPMAPYDAYDEREDTEEKARGEWLRKAREITEKK